MVDLSRYNIPYSLSTRDFAVGLGLAAAAYVAIWVIGYLRVRFEVRGLPAIHSWMETFESGARQKLPSIPFIFPVDRFTLEKPFQKYEAVKSDLIAVSQVTTSHAVYITSNPTTAALISGRTSSFLKPTSMFRYQAINLFGLQIVSSQTGAEHRRHRNVAKGCFNEDIMEVAFDKMVGAVEVMTREENFDSGLWKDVNVSMIKATLQVICEAGFSVHVPWNIPHTDGPLLPFGEALDLVETSMIPQILLPLWLMTYSPFAYLRRCAKAQRSLLHHIDVMIKTRRSALTLERASLPAGEKIRPPKDLLGALVASQIEAEDEARLGRSDTKIAGLTDKEIVGNTFIFIVAGHETGGHTLTWVFGYLALYPQVQEEVYKELVEVCGDGLPAYRDVSYLSYTLAVIYESLRMRDIAMTLAKLAAEDAVVPYTTWDDAGNVTEHSRIVKKGSHVIIDSPACQRNPRYWVDPDVFDPTRHLGDKGAQKGVGFTGFSMGARQCIGKRYAEVEMLAMISHVVKRYKISPVQLDGESWEDTRDRFERGHEELSFTPENFDLKLERR